MPRKRIKHPELPPRWSQKHGAWYYQVPKDARDQWEGKAWFRLGKTVGEAFTTWHLRVGEATDRIKTIGDAIDRYIVEKLPKRAEKTQREYLKALARLRPVFGHMPPGMLKPSHVYSYMDKRPPVAGNREKAVLSSVINLCVRAGVVDRNLVREVARNPEQPRTRYVSDEELDAFRKYCSPLLNAYLDLRMLTGLRQGQLLQLMRSDWDGERLIAPAAKGGKTILYSGPGLAEAVETALKIHKGRRKSLYLFCNRDGLPYTGDGFRSLWSYAMKKYTETGGDSFPENDLRAKVASDSKTLTAASGRLGHQSEQTTQRHYRRKPSEVAVLNKTDSGL